MRITLLTPTCLTILASTASGCFHPSTSQVPSQTGLYTDKMGRTREPLSTALSRLSGQTFHLRGDMDCRLCDIWYAEENSQGMPSEKRENLAKLRLSQRCTERCPQLEGELLQLEGEQTINGNTKLEETKGELWCLGQAGIWLLLDHCVLSGDLGWVIWCSWFLPELVLDCKQRM